MATNFKNKIIASVGTTPETIVNIGPAARATVIGLSLTNLTEGVVIASVTITDESNVTGYYIKNVPVLPNQSLRVVNVGEKLILAASNSIAVVADQEDALDVILSYVEIV